MLNLLFAFVPASLVFCFFLFFEFIIVIMLTLMLWAEETGAHSLMCLQEELVIAILIF